MATVSELIAEWLYEKGITHAFGIVGGGNVSLWDAITRLEKTEIVCVHHEQAAAMASGYFNRVRGKLGSIALVTTGAGSTNALTGVMAAYMDRTPLLVISGNEASKYFVAPHKRLRVQGVQGYDSSVVVHPFTKYSGQLAAHRNIQIFLDRFLDIALKPPMGPVWADFPKDVQVAPL